MKGFKAFGVDPANLLASKSNSAKAGDLRAQTSFRHRFATEFHEVTDSLNPLTMVLLVDDLDRCRPEQVYDMLESINFLTSCGDCFVIMGLARRRVERCVGLVFEKVAAEMPDQVDGQALSDAEKRQRFARQYLEKLINIEVPVPKGEPDQIRTLLVNKAAADPARSRLESAAEKVSDLLPHLLPAALCALVGALAIWCSLQFFAVEETTPKAELARAQLAGVTASSSSVPNEQAQPNRDLPAEALTPQIGSAIFTPGRTGGAPLWAIALLTLGIVVPGIIRLSRRSGSVIEDSPAFVEALEKWFPLLATGAAMTPRTIKRFINRVRYFAMMKGSFRPAPRWWERFAGLFLHREQPAAAAPAERTDESLLVALATIHEKHSEWFAGNFSDFKIVLGQLPEAGASLSALDAATYEHFKKLVAGVEVR